MKRKNLVFGIIGSVTGLLLFLYLCGFGHNLLSIRKVEKIELTACDTSGTSTVELDARDVRNFLTYYNLSRYIGEAEADRCEQTFFICIYMEDGRQISIVDYSNERIKVSESGSLSFWSDNIILLQYIKNLVENYGLQWKNWGCC